MRNTQETNIQGKLFGAVWSRDPAGVLGNMAKKPTELGQIAGKVLKAHENGLVWDDAINEVIGGKGR